MFCLPLHVDTACSHNNNSSTHIEIIFVSIYLMMLKTDYLSEWRRRVSFKYPQEHWYVKASLFIMLKPQEIIRILLKMMNYMYASEYTVNRSIRLHPAQQSYMASMHIWVLIWPHDCIIQETVVSDELMTKWETQKIGTFDVFRISPDKITGQAGIRTKKFRGTSKHIKANSR